MKRKEVKIVTRRTMIADVQRFEKIFLFQLVKCSLAWYCRICKAMALGIYIAAYSYKVRIGA